MTTEQKTMKLVYTVVERAPGKSYWTRVGVGFENKDGSLNLRLDAIPVNGVLQVRNWEPADQRNEPPGPGAGGGGGGPVARRRDEALA